MLWSFGHNSDAICIVRGEAKPDRTISFAMMVHLRYDP